MEGEDVDEAAPSLSSVAEKGHRQEGPEGIEDGGVVEDFFFFVRLGSSPIPNPDPLPPSTKVAAMALGFRILRLI